MFFISFFSTFIDCFASCVLFRHAMLAHQFMVTSNVTVVIDVLVVVHDKTCVVGESGYAISSWSASEGLLHAGRVCSQV